MDEIGSTHDWSNNLVSKINKEMIRRYARYDQNKYG